MHGLAVIALGLAAADSLSLLGVCWSASCSRSARSTPRTYAAVALLVVVTGVLACWIQARRAPRTDPIRARFVNA